MNQADIGVIGLAVMGENLTLNMASKGFMVAAFNRTTDKVTAFVEGRGANKTIIGAHSLQEFVGSLKKPRKVMLMIKAGKAVDDTIAQLEPLLEAGDIVIDGGNSFFEDTVRRTKALEAKGLLFVGAGVSGGEEGALTGPSIMPGGSAGAWEHVKPIFQGIAAKVKDGVCCDWLGPDGAGHFVKMVHNGIEYGDMQMIAEAYGLLRGAGLTNAEISQVFHDWNQGELESYLVEITAEILTKKDDDTGSDLVDVILDTAGQKGTGKVDLHNGFRGRQPVEHHRGSRVRTLPECVEGRTRSRLECARGAATDLRG
jgi:6-phosphogluconate dehydrogenase